MRVEVAVGRAPDENRRFHGEAEMLNRIFEGILECLFMVILMAFGVMVTLAYGM